MDAGPSQPTTSENQSFFENFVDDADIAIASLLHQQQNLIEILSSLKTEIKTIWETNEVPLLQEKTQRQIKSLHNRMENLKTLLASVGNTIKEIETHVHQRKNTIRS